MWPFKKREKAVAAPAQEQRAQGYTSQLIAARANFITQSYAQAELTSTVVQCANLWSHAFAGATVTGTDAFSCRHMAMMGQSLALRGESLWLIDDEQGLMPVYAHEALTRRGRIVAYRLSIPDAGGGYEKTVLAEEVIHVRINATPEQPWIGRSPLHCAQLTANMLYAIESAVADAYANAPFSSIVVPMPEMTEDEMQKMEGGFRGRRGQVLLRESVQVTAAGSPMPQQDWTPQQLTPNVEGMLPKEMLDAARAGICSVYGVAPALLSPSAQGTTIREAERHLGLWTIDPLCKLVAEEATEKLGGRIEVNALDQLQAYDAASHARSLMLLVQTVAAAKEANVDLEPLQKYLDMDISRG